MSRKNLTVPQKVVHHLGRQELAAQGIEDPSAQDSETVRKAGVKRLGKYAGAVVGTGMAIVAAVEVGNYALDHAETLNRDYNQEHIRNFGVPQEGAESRSAEQLPAAPDAAQVPDIDMSRTVAVPTPVEKA